MTRQPRRFTGYHLLGLLAGVFTLVVVANGVMIYHAGRSFRGVTSDHAYEEGLAYNATLQEKARQGQLQLHLTRAAASGTLVYHLAENDNLPVTGGEVSLTLQRPLGELPSHTVACPEADQSYACPLPALARGQWDLILQARWPGHAATFTDSWLQP